MSSKAKPVGIKETLTSLTIAFMMAFVFRGFVIEGFIIPTGSMAPTLLGKHIRFESPYSGYDWATGPWDYFNNFGGNEPLPRQGAQPRGNAGVTPPLTPTDPMTLLDIPSEENRRLAAGDRVFVLKYLPGLHHPERWDVVVFKNPATHDNYIKRLVGLPGEQLAIVDGDIFVRPFVPGRTATEGPGAWEASDWTIARKNERTQRAMLQPIFDSRFTPLTAEPGYRPPVAPDNAGSWSGLETQPVWSYSGSGPTALRWTNRRPITDFNAYNQTAAAFDLDARPDDGARRERPYPVSDLSLTVAIEPDTAGMTVTPTLEALGMVFQGVIDGAAGTAAVRMRPADQPDAWTVLDSDSFPGLPAGKTSLVEFWHIDQSLWLFVDGKLVCGGAELGAYELTPAQRLGAAMVPSWEELIAYPNAGDGIITAGIFARPDLYRMSEPSWSFAGGPFTVHRLELKRDIPYQPAEPMGTPSRGAHYNNFPTLAADQFFMCGDNSPRSADSRLWAANSIDPWVRDLIDATPGAVNRDLIVGKAFVVYFPAPLDGGPVLAPDFGRVRWIW